MRKNIIITDEYIGSKDFLSGIASPVEVLALTPTSMLSLDKLNIPYKTTDNYYSTGAFNKEIKEVNEEAEKIFKKLDNICERFVGFPYAYSGNILYFLHVLGDLLYLEILCQKINKFYNNVYLVSDINSNELLWDNLTFNDLKSHPSSESISLQKQSYGVKNKLIIMQNILNAEIISDGISSSPLTIYSLKLKNNIFKVKTFNKRGIKYIKKCFKNSELPIMHRWKKKNINHPALEIGKATIFTIQAAHEVAELKPYLQEYNFINPVTTLKKEILAFTSVGYDYSQVKTVLDPFISLHWPVLRPYIESLFVAFHREVVGRIQYFIKPFEEKIDNYDPNAFLFSTGTRDVFDCICGYIANQRHIPVLYFQHGGATVFQKKIYHKYVETDLKIRKTLILNSRKEQKQANHYGSVTKPFGSISRYKLINQIKKSEDNNILFLSGHFPAVTYRSILNNSTDYQYYQISKNILETTKELSLKMDIKLHPAGQEILYHYFNNIIKGINYLNCRIITNTSAESIMSSYRLIILDMLGTTVLPYALALKVPVVLYLKDSNIMNEISKEDLNNRCYVVHDCETFGKVISKYARGELTSKWTEEIIDRYIYPVRKGDPGENIADYIKSIC